MELQLAYNATSESAVVQKAEEAVITVTTDDGAFTDTVTITVTA